MLFLFTIELLLIILISIHNICDGEQQHLHQKPDQYKSHSGWQEPGLWRPKWIMDREYVTEDDKKVKDRLYFKLKSDRTIQIYNNSKRPKIEWKKQIVLKEKAKKLFESGNEELPDALDEAKSYLSQQDDILNVDGTWFFADENPLPTAKVKIETRDNGKDLILHESRCEWGQLDGYAAKFRKGKLYKYKGTKAGTGLPLGKYQAGTFLIKATSHRPLVAKDFLAFQ